MAASVSSNNASKTLAEHLQDGKPQWLEKFLEKPYFEPCLLHNNDADPACFSVNKFCVECKTPVCPRCILEFGHTSHAIIQVFRHVYQDAISVKAIKSFMNINDIQIYKSNQALVVALRPLRSVSKINHDGSAAKLGSRSISSDNSGCTDTPTGDKVAASLIPKNNDQIGWKCQVCRKRLVQMNKCQYCSIQCKLTGYMNKSDHSKPPFLMPGTELPGEGCNLKLEANKDTVKNIEENKNNVKLEENNGKTNEVTSRRRKRKGIPHRAPFF